MELELAAAAPGLTATIAEQAYTWLRLHHGLNTITTNVDSWPRETQLEGGDQAMTRRCEK